jgi:tetratricopeptide (TPR) repeat protein
MRPGFTLGSGLARFLAEKRAWLGVPDTAALVKGWLHHCRYLSFYALSARDQAGDELARMAALPGLPTPLELDRLFNACSLYYQFSCWTELERALIRLHRLSTDIGYRAGLAQHQFFSAALKVNAGDYQAAIGLYRQALDIQRPFGDEEFQAEILNDIGFTYRRLDDNREAEYHYQESLALRERSRNLLGMAESLSNLGILYINQNEFHKAESVLLRALEIETTIGDRMGAGYTLVNLGYLHFKGDRIDVSEEYYSKAFQIRQQIGDVLGLGYCYLQFYHVHEAREHYQQAEEAIVRAIAAFGQAGDAYGLLESQICYASIQVYQNRLGEAAAICRDVKEQVERLNSTQIKENYRKCLELIEAKDRGQAGPAAEAEP